MFKSMLRTFFVTMTVAAASQETIASEVNWSNPGSGRDFVLLDDLATYVDALTSCQSRGMALYGSKYLSSAENEALAGSPIFAKLQAERTFTVGESTREVFSIWHAADVGASSPVTLIMRDGQRQTLASQWRTHDRRSNAICMSVEAFWNQCHLYYKCGSPVWSITTLTDFGATSQEAIRRIIDYTNTPEFSVNASGCRIDPDSSHCDLFLPQLD